LHFKGELKAAFDLAEEELRVDERRREREMTYKMAHSVKRLVILRYENSIETFSLKGVSEKVDGRSSFSGKSFNISRLYLFHFDQGALNHFSPPHIYLSPSECGNPISTFSALILCQFEEEVSLLFLPEGRKSPFCPFLSRHIPF